MKDRFISQDSKGLEKEISVKTEEVVEKGHSNTKLVKKQVLVNRNGKSFYQTVYVNPETGEESDTPKGEEISPVLNGMEIIKYSDKAMLIKGDTYVNKEDLRAVKKEIGVGSWNAKLQGWIFPIKFKDTILGSLWSKQMEKGNEEKANAIKNQKNASLETGDLASIDGQVGVVEEEVSDSNGVKYNISLEDGNKLSGVSEKAISVDPETDDNKVAEAVNEANEFNRNKTAKKIYGIKPIENVHEYTLSDYLGLHGITQEEIDNAVAKLNSKKPAKKRSSFSGSSTSTRSTSGEPKELSRQQLISKLIYKHYQSVQKALNEGKSVSENVLSIYPDLTPQETEEKEEAVAEVPKEKEAMSEETKRKISEALKGKKRGGKEVEEWKEKLSALEVELEINQKEFYDFNRPEYSDPDYNERNVQLGELRTKIDGLKKSIHDTKNTIKALENGGSIMSVEDKLGNIHDNIPSFIGTSTEDVMYDEDTILNKEKPDFIPEMDEDLLERGKYMPDAIKIGADQYLVATRKYTESSRKTGERGYGEFVKEYNPNEPGYAVMSLDQLVLTQDYYITRAKAKNKQKAAKDNQRQLDHWNGLSDKRKEYYLMQRGLYRKLSAKKKKEISSEQWDSMSWQDREEHYKPIKKFGVKRVSVYSSDKTMASSFHSMYERFTDPEATRVNGAGKTLKRGEGRGYAHPIVVKEWNTLRNDLEIKSNDIRMYREELGDGTFSKGRETAYGDSGVSNALLDSHGLKVKRQNGDEISPKEIDEIKSSWEDVTKSFGPLKENAKEFGLKISHSGDKLMHARKALGLYTPAHKAIGVTAKVGQDQFSFTLGHEVAHWIDNSLGKKEGRRFASDNFESTAGQIAKTLREKMNGEKPSKYYNSTCECFARALEQYHAVESVGETAARGESGKPYFDMDYYASKSVYDNDIKPLIEKFLGENKEFFKSFGAMDITKGFIKTLMDAGSKFLGSDKKEKTKDFADCIVFNKKAEVLLLKRADNGKYWLPGGSVDTDDTNHEVAAFRELVEETNLIPDIHAFSDTKVAKNGGNIYVYVVMPETEMVVLDPDEHTDFGWYNMSEIEDLAILFGSHDLLREMVGKAKHTLFDSVAQAAFNSGQITEDEYLNGLSFLKNGHL